MFSVEYDHDEIAITLVDNNDNYEDLIINSFTDIVYLRQWDEETDRMKTIAISPDMWEELMIGIHSPEGVYMTNYSKSVDNTK
jgi:hypothetical protein